jgi:hypothetical protein
VRLAIVFGVLLSMSTTAAAAPRESVQFDGAISNGVKNDPANEVRLHSFIGGYALGRIDYSGSLTSIHAKTWRRDARILVLSPDGAAFDLQPFPSGGPFSELSFSGSFYLPLGTAPEGTWTFRCYEAFDDGGPALPDASWDITFTLTDEPAPPPPAADLGALSPPGLSLPPESYGAGTFKWFKFSIAEPIDAPAGRFLDVDTFGAKVPRLQDDQFLDDTEVGLYDAVGTLVAWDDDSCAGFMSQMSFGAGGRPPKGDGEPFDGRNGDLPAGIYYLAVGPAGISFGQNLWQVKSNGGQKGDIPLTFALGQMPPPECYADFTGDGSLDLFDFLSYVNAFNAAEPAADCTGDAAFDLFDFLCFVNAFNAGC